MKVTITLLSFAVLIHSQQSQREKDAAAVQKAIAKLASTKTEKSGGLKKFLMQAYKDQEDYLETIKETPENELEETLGISDPSAAKGIIESHLEKYGVNIEVNPMTVSKFIPILDKCTNVAELMIALTAPEKTWIAEFNYGQVAFKTVPNPMAVLKDKAVKESDAVFKEVKEAFAAYVKAHCSEKIDDVLALTDEEIEVLMMPRKMKKADMKKYLEKNYKDDPYSIFQAGEYLHLELTTIVKPAEMPKKLWQGMPPNMKWERYKDGDYFVAAPCAVGMIGDESLGNDVFMVVMRKVNGKWVAVGL